MEESTVADLKLKLAPATEALRTSEGRATAGQLALEVMHDIRNPLEALRNLIYLTATESDDPEAVRRYAALADEQVAIVIDIADTTLGFARGTNARKPANLVHLTEAALRIHQRTIEGKKIHLVKDLPDEAVVPVYTIEMLQAISNLITNSLDALPSNGTLCLRLRKRSNGVDLVVADDGHGISEEHAGNSLSHSSRQEDRGTGLGLALTKKIIERHRGTIRMRSSVRPGKSGTTFKISIPA